MTRKRPPRTQGIVELNRCWACISLGRVNSTRLPRRSFLATILVSCSAPALLRAAAANERLNIAVIGCGGRGAANLSEMKGENIVALCDVNERNLDAAAAQHPGARKYADFRQLYDKSDDVDAVVVSTAEHTHAF